MNYRRTNKYNQGLKQYQSKLGIKADGYFGNQTDSAVRNYQKQNGLTVDGIIGKNTIASFNRNNTGYNINTPSTQQTSSLTNPTRSATYTAGDIEDVTPTVPVIGETPEAPVIPPLVTVPTTVEEETTTTTPQTNPYEEQIKKLQADVTTQEQALANLSGGKVQAQQDAGIFERMKSLNESKAKLREFQDKQVEIPLQEKQRYRDAGVVGTKQDLKRATTQDVENATLGALGQSRLVQAQTEAINTNLAIIDQKYTAEKDRLEFEIEQKNKILDTAMSSYKDIITGKQKFALEDRKHKNILEQKRVQSELDIKKTIFSEATKKGYNISGNSDIMNMSTSELMLAFSRPGTTGNTVDFLNPTQEQMTNFSTNDWKIHNELLNADTEEKKVKAKMNAANRVTSNGASTMLDIYDKMLDPKNREGLLNSVGTGVIGRTDVNLLGMGKDTTGFRNAANMLASTATLETLKQLKRDGGTLGALSNEERLMLQQAAIGNLGYLGDGVFEANERDFVKNIEQMKMISMKAWLRANAQGDYDSSGLQGIGYETIIGKNKQGQDITGFDFMSSLYEDAKIDEMSQRPITIKNIRGEVIGQNKKMKVTIPQTVPNTQASKNIIQKIAQAFPEDPQTALAVVLAETGGTLNPSIQSRYVFGKDRKDGTYKKGEREKSFGLFQINTRVHGLTPDQARDIDTNIAYARKLYEKQGWKPWSAFTNGSYKKYLTS